jgi:hypothetical protein
LSIGLQEADPSVRPQDEFSEYVEEKSGPLCRAQHINFRNETHFSSNKLDARLGSF